MAAKDGPFPSNSMAQWGAPVSSSAGLLACRFPVRDLRVVVGELPRSHENALKLSPSGGRDRDNGIQNTMAKWLFVANQCRTPQWQRLGSSADTLQCSPLHLRKSTILGRSFATHYGTSGRQKNELQAHNNLDPWKFLKLSKIHPNRHHRGPCSCSTVLPLKRRLPAGAVRL